MARHRFEENDNDRKWGGPALSEHRDSPPQRHSQEKEGPTPATDSDDKRRPGVTGARF
jgi:hypothetical protein